MPGLEFQNSSACRNSSPLLKEFVGQIPQIYPISRVCSFRFDHVWIKSEIWIWTLSNTCDDNNLNIILILPTALIWIFSDLWDAFTTFLYLCKAIYSLKWIFMAENPGFHLCLENPSKSHQVQPSTELNKKKKIKNSKNGSLSGVSLAAARIPS